jgi:alginate O-acetyltransferase complex protein AlgI
VQKMVIADNLGYRIVNPVYADLAASSGPLVMIATICFAFQIYCDFAAYSNIAIGASKLLGFDLMKNFAYPYFSQSVDEFWRRWHISLSTWFRDYLYIPLGGSRCSSTRYCVNVLITFGVSGLWHGASWTFVIWGLLNGLGVLPGILGGKVDAAKTDARATPGGDRLDPSFAVTGRMLKTFAFICLTWVFFRANTIGEAFNGLVAIPMDLFSIDAWRDVKVLLFQDDGITIVAMMLAFVSAEWVSRRFDHPLQSLILRPMIIRWAVYLILVILAMLFFPMQPSEFIYFQF